MGKWAYGTPEKKMSVLFSESLVLISKKETVRVCGVCEDKREMVSLIWSPGVILDIQSSFIYLFVVRFFLKKNRCEKT